MLEPPPEIAVSDLATLAIFPLPNAVLLPGAKMPLHVFEPRYRQLTRDVLAGSRLLAVARLQSGSDADYSGRPAVYPVCGVGKVVDSAELEDGRYNILLQGVARVRIVAEHPTAQPYRTVRAELLADRSGTSLAALTGYERQLARLWEKIGPHLPDPVRSLRALTEGIAAAGPRADRIGDALLADPDDRQRFLQEQDPGERYCMLLERVHELASALAVHTASDMN